MGNLRVCLVVALAACGGGSNTPDAKVKIIDAAADAKVFKDAPVDAPPVYDFSCFGQPNPGTATDPITASGTTETVNTSFQQVAVPSATVDTCPSSSLTCPASGMGARLDEVTSDATTGMFTTGNLVTGGTPLNAYLKVSKTGERPTFVYPPGPLVKSFSGVPVLMVSPTLLALLSGVAGVTPTAGDGLVVLTAVDCADTLIPTATVTLTQDGNSVGTPYAVMGLTLFINVPADATAGATTVGASYGGMTFPTHTVTSFADGDTITAIRPGP